MPPATVRFLKPVFTAGSLQVWGILVGRWPKATKTAGRSGRCSGGSGLPFQQRVAVAFRGCSAMQQVDSKFEC